MKPTHRHCISDNSQQGLDVRCGLLPGRHQPELAAQVRLHRCGDGWHQACSDGWEVVRTSLNGGFMTTERTLHLRYIPLMVLILGAPTSHKQA